MRARTLKASFPPPPASAAFAGFSGSDALAAPLAAASGGAGACVGSEASALGLQGSGFRVSRFRILGLQGFRAYGFRVLGLKGF